MWKMIKISSIIKTFKKKLFFLKNYKLQICLQYSKKKVGENPNCAISTVIILMSFTASPCI
jgi:hypothetical protein